MVQQSPEPAPRPTGGAPSRSERIAIALRDDILRGRHRAGERLPSERDLAERFEVHRGAVREALKKLEQLGLAHIQRGGARVAPVEEASLDVVAHLLELDDSPDFELIDQVLEAFSGFFGTAVRLAVARGSDEALAVAVAKLERLACEELPAEAHFELFHEVGEHLVDASDNLILKLVRRGLQTHLVERIRASVPVEHRVRSARHDELARRLAEAVRARDGAAAAETSYQLTVEIRRIALAAMQSRPPAEVTAEEPTDEEPTREEPTREAERAHVSDPLTDHRGGVGRASP